ncbi:MAG TPA: putative metal-dependent hydrolase [Bacteroidetes bacterium]|nr:putative metal-dependent hydrolase [Bacteroidota bacterium]HIL56839.1 putative metal-dependent hydrolase [Rhodothermales bacterium]
MTDRLRYPIGTFDHEGSISDETLQTWIGQIAALPAQMREAADGLTEAQLDTPYRPSGWTLRQIIHHVPDSHLHAFVRFKWTLTEDQPVIKAYDEAAWAGLGDVQALPVGVPLAFLDALHARWVGLMRTLRPADWDRAFVHPVGDRVLSLRYAAGMYAWHGRHHLAHLTTTAARWR